MWKIICLIRERTAVKAFLLLLRGPPGSYRRADSNLCCKELCHWRDSPLTFVLEHPCYLIFSLITLGYRSPLSKPISADLRSRKRKAAEYSSRSRRSQSLVNESTETPTPKLSPPGQCFLNPTVIGTPSSFVKQENIPEKDPMLLGRKD